MSNSYVTKRTVFLFGACMGAWCNMWITAVNVWAGFVFAYVWVAATVCSLVRDRGVK